MSILSMKMTCGMALLSKKLRSGETANTFVASGSQTTIAISTIISVFNASWANSMEPGQSVNAHWSPRYSILVTLYSTLIWRFWASGELSLTVLPSLMVPLRFTAPAAKKMLSKSEVFPLRYGPTIAAQRGPDLSFVGIVNASPDSIFRNSRFIGCR
jgi:hypothetical protein